ncbi:MAG: AAA family ATPase [Sulfuriflexus sp.]|nr:AAA family ATPase [Sulfuriflexus sp.]
MITVVANLKGGSGKSTVSFNLAIWLAEQGFEVQALDLDPQLTLHDVARIRKEEGHEPELNVIAQETPDFNTSIKLEMVIDVGAANQAGMREAIRNADRVIIPVPPSQPDVWATQRFLKTVREAREGVSKELEIYVFVNRADTHHAVRESDDTAAALAQLPGIKLLPQRLYQRTIYRRSMSEGLAVFELWRGSKGAEEFETFARALYQ